MPNTENTTTPTTTSIVRPSPHLSRSRSFTMTNYTTINNWSFQFTKHPHCQNFHIGLNNMYLEPIETVIIDSVFTNGNKTAVAVKVITVIRAGIIETILLTSTAD